MRGESDGVMLTYFIILSSFRETTRVWRHSAIRDPATVLLNTMRFVTRVGGFRLEMQTGEMVLELATRIVAVFAHSESPSKTTRQELSLRKKFMRRRLD